MGLSSSTACCFNSLVVTSDIDSLVSISLVFSLSAGISSCFGFNCFSRISVSVNGCMNPLDKPFNIVKKGSLLSSVSSDVLLADFTPRFLISSDRESIDPLRFSNDFSISLLFSDEVI